MVLVWSKIQSNPDRRIASVADYLDWKRQNSVFGEVQAFGDTSGVVVGSIGAYFVGRAMQGMWVGVGSVDPLAFSIVACLLLGSAAVACIIPARRAASVDPMAALPQD